MMKSGKCMSAVSFLLQHVAAMNDLTYQLAERERYNREQERQWRSMDQADKMLNQWHSNRLDQSLQNSWSTNTYSSSSWNESYGQSSTISSAPYSSNFQNAIDPDKHTCQGKCWDEEAFARTWGDGIPSAQMFDVLCQACWKTAQENGHDTCVKHYKSYLNVAPTPDFYSRYFNSYSKEKELRAGSCSRCEEVRKATRVKKELAQREEQQEMKKFLKMAQEQCEAKKKKEAELKNPMPPCNCGKVLKQEYGHKSTGAFRSCDCGRFWLCYCGRFNLDREKCSNDEVRGIYHNRCEFHMPQKGTEEEATNNQKQKELEDDARRALWRQEDREKKDKEKRDQENKKKARMQQVDTSHIRETHNRVALREDIFTAWASGDAESTKAEFKIGDYFTKKHDRFELKKDKMKLFFGNILNIRRSQDGLYNKFSENYSNFIDSSWILTRIQGQGITTNVLVPAGTEINLQRIRRFDFLQKFSRNSFLSKNKPSKSEQSQKMFMEHRVAGKTAYGKATDWWYCELKPPLTFADAELGSFLKTSITPWKNTGEQDHVSAHLMWIEKMHKLLTTGLQNKIDKATRGMKNPDLLTANAQQIFKHLQDLRKPFPEIPLGSLPHDSILLPQEYVSDQGTQFVPDLSPLQVHDRVAIVKNAPPGCNIGATGTILSVNNDKGVCEVHSDDNAVHKKTVVLPTESLVRTVQRRLTSGSNVVVNHGSFSGCIGRIEGESRPNVFKVVLRNGNKTTRFYKPHELLPYADQPETLRIGARVLMTDNFPTPGFQGKYGTVIGHDPDQNPNFWRVRFDDAKDEDGIICDAQKFVLLEQPISDWRYTFLQLSARKRDIHAGKQDVEGMLQVGARVMVSAWVNYFPRDVVGQYGTITYYNASNHGRANNTGRFDISTPWTVKFDNISLGKFNFAAKDLIPLEVQFVEWADLMNAWNFSPVQGKYFVHPANGEKVEFSPSSSVSTQEDKKQSSSSSSDKQPTFSREKVWNAWHRKNLHEYVKHRIQLPLFAPLINALVDFEQYLSQQILAKNGNVKVLTSLKGVATTAAWHACGAELQTSLFMHPLNPCKLRDILLSPAAIKPDTRNDYVVDYGSVSPFRACMEPMYELHKADLLAYLAQRHVLDLQKITPTTPSKTTKISTNSDKKKDDPNSCSCNGRGVCMYCYKKYRKAKDVQKQVPPPPPPPPLH